MAAVPGAGLKFVACRPSWVKPQRGMALREDEGQGVRGGVDGKGGQDPDPARSTTRAVGKRGRSAAARWR